MSTADAIADGILEDIDSAATDNNLGHDDYIACLETIEYGCKTRREAAHAERRATSGQ